MNKACCLIGLLVLTTLMVGCSSAPTKDKSIPSKTGLDIDKIPDAEPKVEPLARYGNPDNYQVYGKRYDVMRNSHGYVERGIASWYGPGFHTKLTSTRDIYDMYGMTAAHKTLPLPTYAQVTNLKNGRRIIVRINDRGPFVDNRIIDLSYVAGIKLGIDGPGTGFVEVRAIDPIEWAKEHGSGGTNTSTVATAIPLRSPQEPKIITAPATQPTTAPVFTPISGSDSSSTASNSIYIQVGAFASPDNAAKLRDSLQLPNLTARVQSSGALYKVQIGPLASVEQADAVYQQLSQHGIQQAHYVTGDGNFLHR